MASYVEMARMVLAELARTPDEGRGRVEALAAIPPAAAPPEFSSGGTGELAPSLKGQAVELWRDGRRFFLVADEPDAQEAMRRFGAHRGEVWTSGELELVASIPDQATRDEVESVKREMDGCLSPSAAGECVSAAEWQAQMLNQMFKEQGVTGQPGRITAATVRHGMKGGAR
jgi:hypothetical protein